MSSSSSLANGNSSASTTSTTATKKKSEPALVLSAQEWKKQLITHEDPGHLHKTLGILCLLSFVWRFAHIGSSDMGFGSHPHFTIPTLTLHLLLTSSAFVFTIPKRRIKDGTRIWPEYRLHAMVFLCRALVTLFLYWYEIQYDVPRQYDANIAIVLVSMAAADLSSASVGPEFQSNSVREFDTHPVVKFFFSVMQFFATAGFLMGARRFSPIFLSVAVVQLTPFLGTLRRKNLLGANFGAFLYGVFLVGSYLISTKYSPGASMKWIRITATVGMTGAIWRLAPIPNALRPLQNKYLIWTTLGLIARHYRPQFDSWTEPQVNTVFRMVLVAVCIMGYFKINYGYNNSAGSARKGKNNAATAPTATMKKVD